MFGAVYANVAPAIPLPPPLRGPVVGARRAPRSGGRSTHLTDRVHPARDDLPALGGNRRAFAQATWRHLLFGIVLGELERRVNAEPEPSPPESATDYSSNGHGSLEHAVSGVQD